MKTAKKTQDKKKHSESREVENVTRDDTPAADWTVERLAAYARGRMAEADQYEEMAFGYGRRSVQEFWLAGRALALISDKLKPEKQWVGWQETCGMSRNRVNQAIRLSRKAKSLDELKDFATIREALVRFKIEKERTPATPTKAPAGPPQNRDGQNDEADERGGHKDDEDQAGAGKDDEQPDTPPQVPFLQAKIRVERKNIVIDAGEIRSKLLLPRDGTVRVVPRWRAELMLAIKDGVAVLILPGLEVSDVATG